MWPKSQTVSVACHWSFLCCYSTGGYRQDDLDIMRLCYLAWSIDVIEEAEEVCTFVLSLILFSMCLIKALSSLPYLAKKKLGLSARSFSWRTCFVWKSRLVCMHVFISEGFCKH